MKPVAFSERLNDALNPIVVKELRQAVQSKFVVGVLFLFLLIQLCYVGGYVVARNFRAEQDPVTDIEAGRQVFMVLQALLLGTCILFLPAYTAIRLAAERSDVNVDLLFVTTLRPRSIVGGKFLASFILALLIFSACTPFMTFTYLLRGIDVASIALVVAIDLFVVAGSVLVAIFLAAIPCNRVVKVILGLAGMFGLFSVFGGTVQATLAILRGTAGDPKFFWVNMLAAGTAAVDLLGFLYVCSVALVSSPSSNRTLPIRLYLLGAWVATGICYGSLIFVYEGHDPITGWQVFTGVSFTLGLLIAINEREAWSPRVARKIPRRWWLRIPAFLLYSGAAGGVALSMLMFGLTFLAALGWETYFTGQVRPDGTPRLSGLKYVTDFREGVGIANLYAYCYAMTAVLFRRWSFLPIKAHFTWLVAIVLILLGSVGPLLLFFVTHSDRWSEASYFYWMLANPAVAMADTAHRQFYLLFLAYWTGIVTVLNLRWFVRQIRAFRPFTGTQAALVQRALTQGGTAAAGDTTRTEVRIPI